MQLPLFVCRVGVYLVFLQEWICDHTQIWTKLLTICCVFLPIREIPQADSDLAQLYGFGTERLLSDNAKSSKGNFIAFWDYLFLPTPAVCLFVHSSYYFTVPFITHWHWDFMHACHREIVVAASARYQDVHFYPTKSHLASPRSIDLPEFSVIKSNNSVCLLWLCNFRYRLSRILNTEFYFLAYVFTMIVCHRTVVLGYPLFFFSYFELQILYVHHRLLAICFSYIFTPPLFVIEPCMDFMMRRSYCWSLSSPLVIASHLLLLHFG